MIETEFEKSQFDKLSIPVHLFTKKNSQGLYHFFPIAKKFKEFKGRYFEYGGKEKVVQFIVLCYDEESPYYKTYPNIIERKSVIAEDLDLPRDDKNPSRFDEDVEAMIQMKSEKVNQLMFRWLRLMKGPEFSHYTVVSEAYYTELQKVNESGDFSAKKLNEIKKMLDEAKDNLIVDDTSPEFMDSFYKFIEGDGLGIRPEEIAVKLQDGIPLKLNTEIL